MVINIGDYIRTSKGRIIQVDSMKTMQMIEFLDVEYGDVTKVDADPKNLIEPCDILRYKANCFLEDIREVRVYKDARSGKEYLGVEGFGLHQIEVLEILTKEQFRFNSFKVKEEENANRK